MRDYVECGLIILLAVICFVAGSGIGETGKLREELTAKDRVIQTQAATITARDAVINDQAREIRNLRGTVHDNIKTIEQLLGKRREQPSRAGIVRRVMEVTAYTAADWPDNPAYGITASGHRLSEADVWKVVAVDSRYWPLGTVFLLQDDRGNWHRAVAKDTGAKIHGPNAMDMFVGMTDRARAFEWGRRQVPVAVLGWIEI